MELVGDIIIYIGLIFMFIGLIGITKYKNFYTRILLTTKIDTIGAITFLIGVAVRNWFSFFSLKALLLVAIMMILDPLATHIMARSAYICGYTPDGQESNKSYNEENL